MVFFRSGRGGHRVSRAVGEGGGWVGWNGTGKGVDCDFGGGHVVSCLL